MLVLGQSNVANHGLGKGACDFGRVFHDGAMAPMVDPIPGGSGTGASIWPRFGELLAASGLASDLVITLRAQGGTSVADWSTGGKEFTALMNVMPSILHCPHPVTHVLYHQGEKDTLLETGTQAYLDRFGELYGAVAPLLPQSRWIICRASWRMGITSDAVREAQEKIVVSLPNCAPGPDTDRLGSEFRHDNTHFNENGLAAFAADLLACLGKDLARSATAAVGSEAADLAGAKKSIENGLTQ